MISLENLANERARILAILESGRVVGEQSATLLPRGHHAPVAPDSSRLKRILVCVDFSEVTNAVIEQAKSLARPAGAEVRLLYVAAPDPAFVGFEAGPDVVRKQVAHTLRDEHRNLEELAERLQQAGVRATPLMVQGATVETILEHVGRFHADLVVLGSHGHGALHHVLAGGVAQGVLRSSPVPVLIVPTARRSGG